jgi:serine/threonine protein kinase/tetratricopeptide (TPR) repeat protein
MPELRTRDNLATGEFAEIEERLERFDAAWRTGIVPGIGAFLPPPDNPSRREVLEELIKIDLEYRWRRAGPRPADSRERVAADRFALGPRLEDYVARFPELGAPEALPLGLIGEEYRVRREWGDHPDHLDYAGRFACGEAALREALERIDRERHAERVHAADARHLDLGALPPAPAGYQILEEIGRGGMGVVYRARQINLDRIVALKMIRSGPLAAPGERERFRREAASVARLHHPHIVQIYEVGECAGQPFFSLEFIEGGSLEQRPKAAPLSAQEAANLVEILARTVAVAHQQGIVHRDLKPANILLQVTDGRSNATGHFALGPLRSAIPKITDFGLAKQLNQPDGPTASGVVLGTPSYMAPEQAEGKPRDVGPAVDIYALGAVLYELLTGRPPFHGETPLDTLQHVLTQEPVPPRRLQPKVPRDLETICLHCLRKKPQHRYSSADALADDLAGFLEGRPIRARPAPAWEWAVKWARRRPAVALLLAANVLGPALLLAWYTSRLRLSNADLSRALATAEEQRADALSNLHLAWQVADDMLMVGQDWFDMTGRYERTEGRAHGMRRSILRKGLACHEMFVRTHEANPAMRGDVARAYGTIGRIHELLGHDADAETAYRYTLRLLQDWLREAPEDSWDARGLTWVVRRLSELYLRKDQPDRAAASYVGTIHELEVLPTRKLQSEAARSCLAEMHAGLAITMRSTGHYVEALAAWDHAIRLEPGPNRNVFLARRAACQACLGDHAGAAEAAQRATAGKPEYTFIWYDAACALSLSCSAALQDARLSIGRRRELAEQYARLALDRLGFAAADHMFTDFQIHLRRLETNRDLDPLRSRPDFQKLVAEQQTLAQRVRATPDR